MPVVLGISVCISIYLCLYLHLPMSATPSNNVCIYIYICLYLYLCQTVFNVWTYVFWWPSTCLPTYPYQCTPVHVIPTVKPIRLSVSHHRHFIPVSFFTSLSRCLYLNPEPTSKTKFYTVLESIFRMGSNSGSDSHEKKKTNLRHLRLMWGLTWFFFSLQ